MKVLFAVWELDPFFKFGGLGDVAQSLPGALISKDVDIRTVIPFYKALKFGRCRKTKIGTGKIIFAGTQEKYYVYQVAHPITKVPVYLIQNRKYLDAGKSAQMFAFFGKAVVGMLKDNMLSWQPDIIHCNDHHTGLIPLLVKDSRLPYKIILTIHNLAYQGQLDQDLLEKIELRHNQTKLLRWERREETINFLKVAIIHSDIITTVSPTYAKEIMKPNYGMGLDEVLRGKEGRVFGILNGIKSVEEHPLRLKNVKYPAFKTNGKDDWQAEKKINKRHLQRILKLKIDDKAVLFGFIGRFEPRQKGLDIMHEMLSNMDFNSMQFVFLGAGRQDWEEKFMWLAKFFPKNVSCNFIFDEHLAKQIYASCDFFLVPSIFEPCGLIQMLAMAHGSIPIAHKTGGLADSITDEVNGFLFESYSVKTLWNKVEKAVDIWKNHHGRYQRMVEAAFAADFSWDKSAKEYLDLYQKLVEDRL